LFFFPAPGEFFQKITLIPAVGKFLAGMKAFGRRQASATVFENMKS
jgi:hypothetical protein